MKYKSFKGSIDSEFTDNLSEFLSEKGNKVVYLNTTGGNYSDAQVAIDMINRQKDKVTFVGVGSLFSAGFFIFYSVKCAKELAPNCTGMWHQPNVTVELNGKGRLDNSSDRHKRNMNFDTHKSTTYQIARELGFNKKEMKKLKKNYYVYFRYKRMKELFKL